MAVSIPQSPFSASFFPTDSSQTNIFPDDSVSIGLYTTFGEDDSNTTSFGSWPDPPYSCSELEVSSFPSSAETTLTSLLNSQVLPCEDDLNLAPEFLQDHFGCHPYTPVLEHSQCVDTPKDMMMEEELYMAEENQFVPREMEAFTARGSSQFSDDDDHFNQGRLEKISGDCAPGSNDEDSVEGEEEPGDGVHIPPPLNMKRIEMHDDAYYESIEAAEVPIDVIENKRPFHCGLAGCDKTFKNPQTMKMHHKTHFSDGSAVNVEDLPTLSPPGIGNGNGNPNSSNSWMTGRSKKIPSRCPKCRKTFVGLYELRRHYGRKHSEGERPFQCRKCDKRFYIEVDLRDHEKLCGEQIECKCGLKFAFKCNMVAHKKAHPACQDTLNFTAGNAGIPNATSATSATSSTSNTLLTSVNIIMGPMNPMDPMNPMNPTNSMNPMNPLDPVDPNSTSVSILSSTPDEDSSRSRWISPGAPPAQRATAGHHHNNYNHKRCHELVEETRPDFMSKLMKVYSRRSLPAQHFSGLSLPEVAPCAAGFDFAALGGGRREDDDSSLMWVASSSYPNLTWPMQGPALSTSLPAPPYFPRQGGAPAAGRLGALDLLHLAGVTPGL